MTRSLVISGESLVKVKGIGALADEAGAAKLWELGLSDGNPIRILPTFHHKDVHIDDYGGEVPAEVAWMLADCTIAMNLISFDRSVLMACIGQAMMTTTPGTMVGAGKLMGGGVPAMQPGNSYVSLNILSPIEQFPWRFPTTYLAQRPVEYPLGTGVSIVVLNWRAIPYGQTSPQVIVPSVGQNAFLNTEMVSAGTVLWDHTADEE